MQLKISIILFILIILISCSIENNNTIVKNLLDKKVEKPIIKKEVKKKTKKKNKEIIISKSNKIPFYFIGDSYFIEGVEYIPKEDYSYNETGLASFYGSQLHGQRTINNEYNKVTELLARHKTLPLPSVVKITNLNNGLSVAVRVNDRGPQNNTRIIQVSRKVSQLLRFYKQKTARVRIEILTDPSKQLKIVTESMNNPDFNITMPSAPTEEVTITDLDNSLEDESKINSIYEQPIKIGFEKVTKTELFVKISGFKSYQDAQNINNQINEGIKVIMQKDEEGYNVLFGPMLEPEADNLFQILVSKGYNNTEIIIK